MFSGPLARPRPRYCPSRQLSGRRLLRRSATAEDFCWASVSAIIDRRYRKTLRAVAADRLDRAAFHRLFAERFFLGRFGLFVNVGVLAMIVATEIRRCGFTTNIAVTEVVID